MKFEVFRKITLCGFIVVLIFSGIPIFAESDVEAPYELPTMTADEEIRSHKGYDIPEKAEEKIAELTVTSTEAVSYGLEHSKVLETLDKKISLATITLIMTSDNRTEIKEAQNTIDDAKEIIHENNVKLAQAQSELNQAQAALDAGVTPVTLPLVDGNGTPLVDAQGNPIVLTPGSHIRTSLGTLPSPALAPAMADALAAGIITKIQSSLDTKQAQIDANTTALVSASTTLDLKEKEFKSVLSNVSDSLGMKLQNSSNVQFTADEASDLMLTMAGVNLDVTRYAKRIYKNQIAMLIQKDYHDALLASKTLDLKKTAEERGKTQYDLIELSYQNGMKSKQDLLLSKMYYDSTRIATRVAEADYTNCLTTLKKDMNLNLDCALTLVEPTVSLSNPISLEEALISGTTNRIEIQKCLGQLQIMKLNYALLEKRPASIKDTNAETEAHFQMEEAELNLDITKNTVASEIRQSYENLMSMQEAMLYTDELVAEAKEVVEISKLKYEQGFGADNALLQSLNLEASSGTIIELIAAEEKLSEIEENVAKIRYNYIMAKIKYYNDAALLNVLED
ncbi:TolC family protein [Fusibacter ferrireducens]|uniref:TolC family protein n=1 Tax=Fusibacter ferrireducens TaxID=2785058 RepID=A0ABR9ZXB1_9FIRM|nr:TolC family protein [Fusibacter ferrireducens]MBF4695112.1 TolC family protein [Fusibacter ferrireducens]